jgi:putative MATE family efflux protein
MEYAQIYFMITVISYPFIAVMTSVAAVFRSMGISKTPMLVTLMMSIINIVLCAILIYGFNMGVMGAAIAALTSRVIASVVMVTLIRNRRNTIYIVQIFRFRLHLSTIRDILKVGIPSGIDAGMFQLGRLIMQSLIATFGTVSIAANAVFGQIFMIIMIPGGAISMALITVVGQCVGANDYPQAISYTKRLVKYSYIATASLCVIAYIFANPLLGLFNLSPEALSLSYTVLIYTFIFTAFLHPLAFSLPNALRASGDVNFTLITSISSMWIVRICMAYILEYTFRLGLMSVWFAMYADWFVRAIAYTWRFESGKWKTKRVV